jgi:hypothetical protein
LKIIAEISSEIDRIMLISSSESRRKWLQWVTKCEKEDRFKWRHKYKIFL